MNKINIAFSINDNYVDYATTTIFSILQNNQKNDITFYILSSDISDNSKKIIKRLVSTSLGTKVIFVAIDKGQFDGLRLTIDYISKETYYRYALASLLPSVDKILYMDADILVIGDLSPLWDEDITAYYAAGVEDLFIKQNYKQEVGFSDKDLYVNAGVLLLNLYKIRKDKIEANLYKETQQNKDILYQDQDVINIVFKGKIKQVENIFNFTYSDTLAYKEKYKDVIVVHYNGAVKPWTRFDSSSQSLFFFKKYQQYDDMCRKIIQTYTDLFETKYGLLTYKTTNIGDDVQSIAASRFLPQIDYYFDRDDIESTYIKKNHIVKIIMNGWYMERPFKWPPTNRQIVPLLTSMFVTGAYDGEAKVAFQAKESIKFLTKHSPVGARSRSTESFLKQIGVDSHFSGCMTLTLKADKPKKKNIILAIDVSNDILNVIKFRNRGKKIITLSTHVAKEFMSISDRMLIARYFLDLYASAGCVITTRLHSALPCLALETPVLLLDDKSKLEPDRFDGLLELVHHSSSEDFINNSASIFNVNNPPKNPDRYKKISNTLAKTCKKFTGYESKISFTPLTSEEIIDNPDFIQLFSDGVHDSSNYETTRKLVYNEYAFPNDHIQQEVLNIKERLEDGERKYADLQGKYTHLEHRYARTAFQIIRKQLMRLKRILND